MATLQNKAIDVCKLAGDVLSADECHCLPAIQVHPRHPNAAFVTRLDACAEPQVQQIGMETWQRQPQSYVWGRGCW